jgi:hypothetical protein
VNLIRLVRDRSIGLYYELVFCFTVDVVNVWPFGYLFFVEILVISVSSNFFFL